MNPYRLILLAGALLLIQALVGGTRLVFALPAYALIALVGLSAVAGRRGGFSQPKWYCILSAFLLFGWITLRALTSPIPYLAWPDLYMVIACLLVYGAFAWFFTGTRERLWMFGFLLVLALVQVCVGIRQFKYGDDWMVLNLGRSPNGSRASGFFVHSISLAGYLEAVGGLALSLACWSRWRMEARVATGFAALFCYLGVVITGSRGGYLSVAVSVFVFFFLSLWMLARLDRRKFLIALVAGLAGLFLVGSLATAAMNRSNFLKFRLTMLSRQFEGKWDVRIYNWQAALDQFSVSPVTGTGAGTHLYLGRFFRRPQVQADPIHAHSDYLELLAEYGALGAAAMLLFLGAHCFSGLRSASLILKRDVQPVGESRDGNLALQLGLLTAVSSYLAHSAMDFNMHIPGNALLFAIIFGCMAQPRPVAATHTGWALPTLLPRAGLPALSFWLLCSALLRFPGEYWAEESRKALRDRNFVQSLIYAEKSIKLEPRNPEVYFYRGEAYRAQAVGQKLRVLRKSLLEQAIAAYDASLRIFPQEENAWVRRGQALDGLARYSEAATSYLTAIALDPNLGVLYAYYAGHLKKTGHEEEAQNQIDKARQFTQDDLSHPMQDPFDNQRLRPVDATAQ